MTDNPVIPAPKKVIRNGKVGVLVSPGYGTGWSTWEGGPGNALAGYMAMDQELIYAKETKKTAAEVEAMLKERVGAEQCPYVHGWEDTVIAWVPVGTRFIIQEYDGSESLYILGEEDSFIA